jgi:hypothetical protein
MKRLSFKVAAVLGVVLLAGSIAVTAQAPAPAGPPPGQGRGAAPPPPKNLQIFTGMTFQQIIPIMQAFNQALGVTCAHCHVFVGPNDPMNDFAADTKPQKNIARQMVLMVRQINPLVQKAAAPKPSDQVAAVNCAMCHRGAAIPMVAAAAPAGGRPGGPGAPGAPGAPAPGVPPAPPGK